MENADRTVITETRVMNYGFDGIHFSDSTNSVVRYTHIFHSSHKELGFGSPGIL